MKRLSLTLTLALLVFASLSFAQDSTTGIVRGQVLDTTSQRNPVAGVEVIIVGTSGNEERATTDEAGSYRMENVQPGRYCLLLVKLLMEVDKDSRPLLLLQVVTTSKT